MGKLKMGKPSMSARDSPRPSSRRRAALRVVCWNALFLAVPGGVVGYEVWLRAVSPFVSRSWPVEFVPGVGRHPVPNAEVRWTNLREFWTVSRTNSLGFLDREPPSPERAAASCHVAFVGDSFVEAAEVGIADKLQVRLEESATERLPQLDVTVSAWGRRQTGQIAQLPFYDKWVRRLRPKLVVLVFVPNDFRDNSGSAVEGWGWDFDRPPRPTAVKEDGGRIAVRLPHPNAAAFRAGTSLQWLKRHLRAACRVRPLCTDVFLGPVDHFRFRRRGVSDRLISQQWQEPEDFTLLGLDQWKQRTSSDGVALVVLAIHSMGTRGNPRFDGLAGFAEARNIPVIDQADWILRQGGALEDAEYEYDLHWTPQGHQWAAEAVLEWLKRNQSVCGE